MAASQATLREKVARAHAALAARVAAADQCPTTVLALGSAVLLHAAIEEEHLGPLSPLLDPEAVRRLKAEHEGLADDLGLLDSLWSADPGAADVRALSDALLARLRDHVLRDQRLFHESRAGVDRFA